MVLLTFFLINFKKRCKLTFLSDDIFSSETSLDMTCNEKTDLYWKLRLASSDKNIVMPELVIDAGVSKARRNCVLPIEDKKSRPIQGNTLTIPGNVSRKMNKSQIKVQDKAGFKKYLHDIKQDHNYCIMKAINSVIIKSIPIRDGRRLQQVSVS